MLRNRPAETAGAAVATLAAGYGLAVENWLAVLTAAAGFVPAVWTFLKVNGGVRGVLRTGWRGQG